MFSFCDSFLTEPFAHASSVFILVVIENGQRFMAGRSGNRIQALGLRKRFHQSLLWIDLISAGEFARCFIPIGLRYIVCFTSVDESQLLSAFPNHVRAYRANSGAKNDDWGFV